MAYHVSYVAVHASRMHRVPASHALYKPDQENSTVVG